MTCMASCTDIYAGVKQFCREIFFIEVQILLLGKYLSFPGKFLVFVSTDALSTVVKFLL